MWRGLSVRVQAEGLRSVQTRAIARDSDRIVRATLTEQLRNIERETSLRAAFDTLATQAVEPPLAGYLVNKHLLFHPIRPAALAALLDCVSYEAGSETEGRVWHRRPRL